MFVVIPKGDRALPDGAASALLRPEESFKQPAGRRMRPPAGVDRKRLSRRTVRTWLPRRFSIRLALAATSGVTIAVTAAALFLALESGRQNTSDLVRDRSDRIIAAIVDRTRLHLDPARDQSCFLARMVADGTLDPSDEPAFIRHLSAALAGTPQVATLSIIRTDLRQIRVERQGDEVVARSINMRTVPGLHEAFEMAEERRPAALGRTPVE